VPAGPIRFSVSSTSFMLPPAMVTSQPDAARLCSSWHPGATLAHWDNLAAFNLLTAKLSDALQGSSTPQGSNSSYGSTLTVWTSALWRQSSWWWHSVGTAAAVDSLRWAPGFPASTAAAPFLVAFPSRSPSKDSTWAVGNVASGMRGYALCELRGEGGVLQWQLMQVR
jgi:hypothetical protein